MWLFLLKEPLFKEADALLSQKILSCTEKLQGKNYFQDRKIMRRP